MDGSTKTLVIFDCDGVLVDSEPIALEVLIEALREKGVNIDQEGASERFLGRSLAHLAQSVEAEFGVEIDAEFLSHMREALYRRFRTDLKPLPGIPHVMQALRDGGLSWCVASSSQKERVELSLTVTGLIDYFAPDIFSATMVKNGKPAPDLFLHAAAEMGFPPEHCIVVEDSPAGIQAARAAGMRVCAFTGGSHTIDPAYRASMASLTPDASFDRMEHLVDFVCPRGPD
ncbi:HAD family phosphatase [Rhizobium sp. AAP43]|uniref:HAD family hydrolase n=1 Tax=Rhizobium sp. AAP43 TaxID=1523420 RepID=UPI0006B98698|nr:HAD family hydrolase [Rhizobium sp. AAP43]KPF41334.1 hydrolase [Rhizobium sp. AAP43]